MKMFVERDAYTGALFLFCSKAKDKLKLVYWDKTGFALWYKRLEKQKFKWPNKTSLQEFELSPEQLDWLLSTSAGYHQRNASCLGHERNAIGWFRLFVNVFLNLISHRHYYE